MNKLLLIVDPQVDFVTGSLPVPGAEESMLALSRFIAGHGADYRLCVITADWHPASHISFVENGGEWPRHCVAFSVGAAIFQPVYAEALSRCKTTLVLTKGVDPGHEEYSIFANGKSARALDRLIKEYGIDHIDVCGLAGDVCVSNTLADAITRYGAGKLTVLTRFSPSIDGGAHLQSLISKHKLLCDQ